MDGALLRSKFIVWVDFGLEGWAPFVGYDSLEDAERSVSQWFTEPAVVTGPILFPPAKED